MNVYTSNNLTQVSIYRIIPGSEKNIALLGVFKDMLKNDISYVIRNFPYSRWIVEMKMWLIN